MARVLPSLLARLIAILAIALYGMAASASVARGPVSQIVICAASIGTTVIHVDANGNQVDGALACCDCLKCLTFATDQPQADAPAEIRFRVSIRLAETVMQCQSRPPHGCARCPVAPR